MFLYVAGSWVKMGSRSLPQPKLEEWRDGCHRAHFASQPGTCNLVTAVSPVPAGGAGHGVE